MSQQLWVCSTAQLQQTHSDYAFLPQLEALEDAWAAPMRQRQVTAAVSVQPLSF
jgi:hypothetical protein